MEKIESTIKICKKKKINNIIWPSDTTKLYLHYFENILPKTWPDNLSFLEVYFRPDFDLLPKSIKILSIVTQNEVLKSDLPSNIEQLWITAPNAVTTKFDVREDNFDLYKISIKDFNKYNIFIGGYSNDDNDNIKHHRVLYQYETPGDTYPNGISWRELYPMTP